MIGPKGQGRRCFPWVADHKIFVFVLIAILTFEAMSSPREGRGQESSFRLEIPLVSSGSRLSIEEDYFTRSKIPTSPSPDDSPARPASTDLPASLALPLTRSRSSTPNTATPLRAGPSISVDDDSASVRSFVPTVSAGDDLEAMLSEMLGSDTRWRMEEDEDIDVWEGESEGDSDSDLDMEDEPEDDGIFSLDVREARLMVRG